MILNLTGKIAPIACGLLCCCSMVYAQGNDTSEVMLLDTGWEFSQSGTEKWMPATVPGTVHQDLISHELLPNPFYGMNEKKIQWVENEDWEYRTSFIVSEEQLNRDGIQLIFEGLDTYADVYLNGSLLLKADNMFVGYTLPVKSVLRKGENHLYIYFHSPIRQTLPQYASNGFNYPADNDHHEKHLSVFSRKAPYSYGWDWGIRMVTSGVWRPVTLRFYDIATISDYHVRQLSLTDENARLSNELIVNQIVPQKTPAEVRVNVSLNGTTVTEVKQQVTLQPGINHITLPAEVTNPVRWMPNGWGTPTLYDFSAQIACGDRIVAEQSHRIGLRTIRVVNEKDKDGESFYFEVNGIPMFAKGANYIPQDALLPNVTTERYQTLFRDMKEANMNMVRIWGGGTYENNLFYDLADENGILVWQDFMFACAMYPGDPEFLENVKQEAVDNVIRLRNHPCIALWCGNNEIDAAWRGWGWKREYTQQQQERIFKAYTDVFHRLLPEVIEKYTDGDDYWPSSPMSGPEIGDHEIRPANRGDNHYWGVWHEKHKFEEYEKNIGRFISEHGFQSFPEFETVRQYTLPEDYDIESEIMSAHQRSGIGNLRIREYMGWYYQVPEDFGQMLYMSQVLQARAMRIAMETHRRHMPYCMGSLVWQLNDCWPVASWSTTDYYHNWKAAQYALREACKPVILAPQLTADSLKLWVVNDLPTPLAGTYTLEIKGFDGKLHQTRQGKYKIKANKAAPIAASSIAGLLQDNSHRETMAVITIRQGKKIVDRQNVYFALPKELLLRQPDIQIQISEEQGKKYLTATTDRLACDVMFYLPGVKAVFTDNYKDLLPGHPFRTEIRTPLSKEEIEQQIRCRWVGK